VIGRATGAAEVDVGCTDASERNEQRKGECGDCQEYRLVRQKISDQAHEGGRDQISRRGEALIASEAFRQRRMANQAEANRSDRRPEEAARASLQHQGREDQRKARLKRNNDRTDGHHYDARHNDRSLRADGIQQFASRELTEQAGKAARGQDETDVFLRPFLVSQISGQIGTEASQNTGKEKVDFVKAAEADSRRCWTCSAKRCRGGRHLC
jgi:hypothetical protein